MSFISTGRQSSTPSILKRPSLLKATPGRTVKFQIECNVKNLLHNFISENNKDAYVELICKIRDAGDQLTDDQLISIIADAKDCISILNENLKLFVQVLLLLKWVHRSDETVKAFKNFILDLCSAHNYYTKYALQQLVAVFPQVIENSLHHGCTPSEQEERGFLAVHEVIKSLLKIVPMSRDVLLSIIKRKFPFRTESARNQLNYVHNILAVATYEPSLKREILVLIITKLILLDTISSKEDIEKAELCDDVSIENNEMFAMEVDDVAVEEDMKHPTARTLDYCLHRFFRFVYTECHDKNNAFKPEKAKLLYQDFVYIFENVILSTYECHHTQFVVLYLISFSPKLTSDFVNYLWNKVTNRNVAPVIREAAVSYLAGILGHASFISFGIIKTMLQNISLWLHQYVVNVSNADEDTITVVRVHGVFYATCQALFHIINTRHMDFVKNEKNLKFLADLNLGKIVMCRLSPLQVCARSIVNQFIKITKTYQLIYCVTVLNNSTGKSNVAMAESGLNGYFPFSCYLLRKSNEIINPIRRIVNVPSNEEATEKNADDDEDFIPAGSLSHSPHVPVLGSSPYFSCAFGT